MARYRHYRNYGQGGEVVFVTTACLDFAHLFRRVKIRSLLVRKLAEDHIFYRASLLAYVAMTNHVHFISQLPVDKSASWFVQRFKSNSAKAITPLLSDKERKELSLQNGLNRRQFWQRSFHSIALTNEKSFWQKVAYIHQNPVKAELVETAEDYEWSSAHVFSTGQWNEERGIAQVVLDNM